MVTKIEILEKIKKINLSKVSTDYIEHILRNFDDKEVISKEKLKVIIKVVELEEKMNDILITASEEMINNLQKLI